MGLPLLLKLLFDRAERDDMQADQDTHAGDASLDIEEEEEETIALNAIEDVEDRIDRKRR